MSASSPYVTSEATGSDGVLKAEGAWVPAYPLGAKSARNVYAGLPIARVTLLGGTWWGGFKELRFFMSQPRKNSGRGTVIYRK